VSARTLAPVLPALQIADPLTPADYIRIAREIRRTGHSPLTPIRLAFLSSYTVSFLEPTLIVEAARQGLLAEIYVGAFGQFEQEVVPGSPLHAFEPDVLIISMRPEDMDPDAIDRYHASGGQRFDELSEELAGRTARLIGALREWSRATVLVASFAAPSRLPFGIGDANLDGSLTYAIATANARLRRSISTCRNAVIWDYAGLVHSVGSASWSDPRLMAMARIPVAARHHPALARHLLRTVTAARREPAKCLVLDLDNTLWGGVIGDDGIAGIRVGDDYPGNVYKSFQRSVLALMDRGILLALSSKNDHDLVDQVLRDHPDMLVRWEHIAAARIGWYPKSQGLREIASELGIGTDALVLFDDNPVERAEVRANLPEVGLVDVPADPLHYRDALWSCGYFDQINLSDEDRRRNDMYQAERERRTLASRVESVDEFLESLEMIAEIGEADDLTMGRIAQLVGKTNQFNLTTRRYSAAELEALSRDPRHVVLWIRIRDRFGDQGLVGVAILRLENEAGVVDTLLMSCRMMNRYVEHALMAELVQRTRSAGRNRLLGEYRPTVRNSAVADLYPSLGFVRAADEDSGRDTFELDLATRDVTWPDVIRRGPQIRQAG
jgi:FkbH-like protein